MNQFNFILVLWVKYFILDNLRFKTRIFHLNLYVFQVQLLHVIQLFNYLMRVRFLLAHLMEVKLLELLMDARLLLAYLMEVKLLAHLMEVRLLVHLMEVRLLVHLMEVRLLLAHLKKVKLLLLDLPSQFHTKLLLNQ